MEAKTENLNAIIADLLGYTDLELTEGWFDNPDDGPFLMRYYRAKNKEGIEQIMPDWEHDANAALSLPLPDSFYLIRDIEDERDGWEAAIHDRRHDQPRGWAKTPSEATCRAFIAWKTNGAIRGGAEAI